MRLLRLLSHYVGLAYHPEPWSGPPGAYYISDKESTCAYLLSSGRFSQAAVDRLREVLGTTMTATIAGRYFLVAHNYAEEIAGLRTVRRGRDWIISEFYSAVYQRTRRSKILKDQRGDGYWVSSERPLRGYRERFQQISESDFFARVSGVEFDESGFPVTTPPSAETLAIGRRLR